MPKLVGEKVCCCEIVADEIRPQTEVRTIVVKRPSQEFHSGLWSFSTNTSNEDVLEIMQHVMKKDHGKKEIPGNQS